MEGNLRFKIDWAGLQWEGNLPFLLCFTLYSRANFKYKPPPGGRLYWEGRCNGGFFGFRFWGPYIWRGLFLEFYGTQAIKFMTKSIKLNLYSEFNLTIIDPCKILREIENKPVQFLSCFSSRMLQSFSWYDLAQPIESKLSFSVIKRLELIA